MTIGIYKITNKVNGKSYIGQSVYLEERVKTHFNDAKKGYNSAIANAIRKHGEQNFTIEILFAVDEVSSLEEIKTILNSKEIEFIEKFNSYIGNSGYNLTLGGDGPLGVSWSDEAIQNHRSAMSRPEVKAKISERTKVAMARPEVIEKIKGANIGRVWAEDRKQKYSLSISGANGVRAQPVKETTTTLVFGCIRHAAESFDISRQTVGYCCKKNRDKTKISGVLVHRLNGLNFEFITKEEFLATRSEDYLKEA